MRLKYINVKKATEALLRDWYNQSWKLSNKEMEIEKINARLTNTTSKLSAAPSHGGGNKVEEAIVEGIYRKDALEEGERQAEEYFAELLPAWEQLTDEEREILTSRFIERDGNVFKIMKRLHIEKSEAYRRSDAALEHLGRLLYWR